MDAAHHGAHGRQGPGHGRGAKRDSRQTWSGSLAMATTLVRSVSATNFEGSHPVLPSGSTTENVQKLSRLASTTMVRLLPPKALLLVVRCFIEAALEYS
jgi:hypothetical protein